jgi:hypothetical protein
MEDVPKVPGTEILERGWVPFAEGEEIELRGIVFRLVRVKQLRRELHLAYVRKAAPGTVKVHDG